MADCLQLSDAERNCLGNWQDGARLPLAVRYSAERLETAAGVRRLCLAAMRHLLQHVADPSWSRLRAVVPHLPQLRRLCEESELWGLGTAPVPPPEPRSPTECVSSSNDSSKSPSSDESWAPRFSHDVEGLIFVRPSHGMWHVTEEYGSYTPHCCAKTFRPKGVRWARGHTETLNEPAKFCGPCLLRLPERMRVQILASLP